MWLTRQLPLQLAYSDGAKRPVRQVRFHCTWLGAEWRRERPPPDTRPPPVSDGSLTPPERASPPSGASSVSSTSTQPADSLRTLRSTTAPGPVAPMRKRSGPPGSAACAARRPVLARLEPAASGPSRRRVSLDLLPPAAPPLRARAAASRRRSPRLVLRVVSRLFSRLFSRLPAPRRPSRGSRAGGRWSPGAAAAAMTSGATKTAAARPPLAGRARWGVAVGNCSGACSPPSSASMASRQLTGGEAASSSSSAAAPLSAASRRSSAASSASRSQPPTSMLPPPSSKLRPPKPSIGGGLSASSYLTIKCRAVSSRTAL